MSVTPRPFRPPITSASRPDSWWPSTASAWAASRRAKVSRCSSISYHTSRSATTTTCRSSRTGCCTRTSRSPGDHEGECADGDGLVVEDGRQRCGCDSGDHLARRTSRQGDELEAEGRLPRQVEGPHLGRQTTTSPPKHWNSRTKASSMFETAGNLKMFNMMMPIDEVTFDLNPSDFSITKTAYKNNKSMTKADSRTGAQPHSRHRPVTSACTEARSRPSSTSLRC